MKAYIEECQNIINPLTTNIEYPNKPSPLPFTKKPKTTPTKRRCMETKHNIKELYKSRKVDKGCSERFQYNGLAQAKTAQTTTQNPTLTKPSLVAIPIQKAAPTVIYVQPVTIPSTAPTKAVVTASGQPNSFQNSVPYVHPQEDNAQTITYCPYIQNGQIHRRKRRTLISKKKKQKKRKKIGMVPYKRQKEEKEQELIIKNSISLEQNNFFP